MVSALISPKYYSELKTIQDVVNSKLSIYIVRWEYNIMKNTLRDDDAKLLNNLIISPNESLYQLENNFGLLTRFEKAREFLKIRKKLGGQR